MLEGCLEFSLPKRRGREKIGQVDAKRRGSSATILMLHNEREHIAMTYYHESLGKPVKFVTRGRECKKCHKNLSRYNFRNICFCCERTARRKLFLETES